jgi:hypothetical protein
MADDRTSQVVCGVSMVSLTLGVPGEKMASTIMPRLRSYSIRTSYRRLVRSARAPLADQLLGLAFGARDPHPSPEGVMIEFHPVTEHIGAPGFQCGLRRRPGRPAFWDIRSTQHHAVADSTERRRMHRVTINAFPEHADPA